MLASYRASVNYILAEQRMLGNQHASLAQTQEARIRDFVNALHSFEANLEDAVSTQQELSLETPAFTTEQRTKMAEAVRTRMNSSVATAPTATSNASQTHLWLHHYLTEQRWEYQRDLSIDFDLNRRHDRRTTTPSPPSHPRTHPITRTHALHPLTHSPTHQSPTHSATQSLIH